MLVAYRYGSLKENIAEMEDKIQTTKDKIRAKNPYLLTFIDKI